MAHEGRGWNLKQGRVHAKGLTVLLYVQVIVSFWSGKQNDSAWRSDISLI